MIDALISNSTIRMLEQSLNFTEQRHNVLLEDIANASTPGFVMRDLSVKEFQTSLRKAVETKRKSYKDIWEPESGETFGLDPEGSDVTANSAEVPISMPFHDRGVRSMEYLMGQLADNALAHNMTAQFLKNRYDTLSRAISMKA
jgi:flagellar basal-body rod protein FlgB